MIINEALCYIQHFVNSSAHDNVKRIIVNFYTIDELIEAKKALWKACGQHLGKYHDRRTTDDRPAISAYAQDIMEAVNDLDKLPDVVARNISRLPDRQPEELNMLRLVQRIADLEKSRDRHNETLTNLAIDVLKLNDNKDTGNSETSIISANKTNNKNIAHSISSYKAAVANTQVVVPAPTNVTNSESPENITPQLTVTPATDEEDNDSTDETLITDTANTTPVENSNANNRSSQSSVRNLPPRRPPSLSGRRWGPPGPAAQHRNQRWSASDRAGNRNSHGDVQNRDSNDGFTLVQRRRKPRGRYGSTSVPGLQGAPLPISRVFVYRVTQGDVQTINTFLHKNKIDVIENKKVSHDDAAYSSFKVTLSVFDRNKVLRDRFWPRGIQCKLWHDPKSNNYGSDNDESDSIDNDSELTGYTRVAQS